MFQVSRPPRLSTPPPSQTAPARTARQPAIFAFCRRSQHSPLPKCNCPATCLPYRAATLGPTLPPSHPATHPPPCPAVRTSWGTFLTRGQDEVVYAIEHRLANWTHLPADHAGTCGGGPPGPAFCRRRRRPCPSPCQWPGAPSCPPLSCRGRRTMASGVASSALPPAASHLFQCIGTLHCCPGLWANPACPALPCPQRTCKC